MNKVHHTPDRRRLLVTVIGSVILFISLMYGSTPTSMTPVDAFITATRTPRISRTTATSTPETETYYITANANGRSCPKLSCEVIELFVAGEAIEVIDEETGDSVRGSRIWRVIEVDDELVYIHSSLTTDQKPAARPTRRSTSTGNQSSGGTPEPISTPSSAQTWSCAGDLYNCSDFSNRTELMSYFNACPGDPSGLDGNNDGVPCESLR